MSGFEPSLTSGRGPALVADDVARPAGEARREDRQAWPLDRRPDGRDHGAPHAVPADTQRQRGCVRRNQPEEVARFLATAFRFR